MYPGGASSTGSTLAKANYPNVRSKQAQWVATSAAMIHNGEAVIHKLGNFDDTASEAAVRLVRAGRKVKKNISLARKTERLRILEIAKLAFEVRTSRQRIYVCLNVHKI